MNKNKEYESIINMRRPVSKKYRPMSLNDRAAQFSAFAALTGYGDEIKEKARYTAEKAQITEEKSRAINDKLVLLAQHEKEYPSAVITVFIKDEYKSGGRYEEKTVRVRRVDEITRLIITDKNEKIPIDSITDITGEIFKEAGL